MEANSRLFRTFIETLFTKKERRENRLVEIQSGLSDYLDFVGTKTSQAFKKDVFAAVKLKKFLQNGEPNLRKFLEERRCSVVLDKEEETSENRQQAKCTDTQPDPAFLTSCNSVRGNQEQVSHSRQFDFNFIKTEYPASTRYAPSLIGFEERELAKQDLAPKNVQRFKINLEDNKIGNHDSSNRASVRPSSCAPSNRTRRQTRPMSAMKTSFQAPDKNSIDISTANEDTFNTTLPSTTWKCTPRQDYLSNRARSSKTGDVISPGLFQHITRKSFFITDENSFLKRPERTRIDCTSVRGSMDASYITSPSLTNRVSLNRNQITQKIRDSHKHQHKEGEDCESKKGVRTENRDDGAIRAHRNQRPISAMRPGKLEDCDKTYRKERSVNKTCSTEPQTEERSRLFNQALQETYGKRLIKLENLFNNIRNLKRKRENKEQHCH